MTWSGTVSGTGNLNLTGSGVLVLGGINTYSGETVVNPGGTISLASADAFGATSLIRLIGDPIGTVNGRAATLRFTGSTTVGANIVADGDPIIDIASGEIVTLAGDISDGVNPGDIVKVGAGRLILTGANTYTGGTIVSTGELVGNTTSLQGAIANNAAVEFAQATNGTYGGVMSGSGTLTKTGAGAVTLTGANTYTGGTTVAVGTLNVTGSLVSAVTVNSGAALNGTGTVGALNVLAGGSVNPGAPGTADRATLTVTGAATLNGTYTANIASNDRITAGGALTLGGTLAVVPVVPGGFTQFNTVYTVASGSTRTGTFATTTGLDQFGIAFNPLVEYTATQANIRLAPQSLVTLGNRFGGISGNQLEVALAFDRAVAAGYNPQAFFAVYANAGSNLPRTLREMSGEQRATERRVVLDTNRVFRETALDRLNLGMSSMAGQQVSSSDGDRSLTFWLRGAGSWGKAQTSGAATSFQTEQVGLLTGIDWSRDALTVGGMFHFTTTNVEFGVLGGSSRVETVGGTVYGGYRKDSGLVANGGISVSSARANGSRAITLAGFSQSLAGCTTGTTYQFFGELAWDLAGSADTRIEPFARMTLVKANMNGLTETGGVAALTAAKQNYDITVTNLGMRFGTNVADGKVALNVSAAWQGTTGDRDAATIIGIPAVGQNGNIRSVLIDRSALLLQGGVGVNLSDTIRFNLDYSGLIGKRNDDHGGRATLNFKF